MSERILTDANFQQEVLKNTKPVLVDFWAPWCVPCKMQEPILHDLAVEIGEQAIIAKLNVDDNPQTASSYAVMSIPTILIFKDGKVVDQFFGVQRKEVLNERLHAFM